MGLVITQIDNSQRVSVSGNELGLKSQSIGVVESLIEPVDGNFVVSLLNNSGDVITVSNVSVGDSNVDFSEDLAQGGSRYFVVDAGVVCEEGRVVSEDVIITYVTREGLTKTEKYPVKVMFDCTPYNINQAVLANQCPSCETCADPVELHSGQQSCYDIYSFETCPVNGFPNQDAEQDGTAKSYTDNGDGTVTDNHTGLIWQKNHKEEGGTCDVLTWEGALSYCSTLADGVGDLTDGSSAGDWRVPSYIELATLPDMSYPSSSYLNSVFTRTGWNSTCYGYWSSTTVPSDTSFAYYLNSLNGNFYDDDKTEGSFTGARCVRSGN